MVIYRRKFTWKNLLDMFRINLAFSVALINPYMALSKLLKLGMQKWIAFSLTLVFLDVIMPRCDYSKKLGNHLMIPVLYVDHGLILIGIDPKLLTYVKFNLKKKFE